MERSSKSLTAFVRSYPNIDPIESVDLMDLEICELTPLSPTDPTTLDRMKNWMETIQTKTNLSR